MIGFLGGALLLSLVVLAYVLWPLLRAARNTRPSRDTVNVGVYRDQLRELDADLAAGVIGATEHAAARAELERRVLEDIDAEATSGVARAPGRAWIGAIVLAILIPGIAGTVYLAVGAPQAISVAQTRDPSTYTPEEITAMVERFAARMKQNPEDATGWVMLGRSYSALGRYPEAAAAYSEATKRMPDDAQVLADYADALGMAQGRLAGEPEALIARALKADPDNGKSLALAGTVAFEHKDYAGAVRHWERLLKSAPPGSELAQSVQASIDEARGRSGQPAAKPASTAMVQGTARLSPKLASRVAPGDSVFIFAQATDGPRMPLAVLRKKASDLPVTFVLDDSMAMSPQAKLSAASRVVVTARVSKSGEATPHPGDLEGRSAPIQPGGKPVEVTIDTEVK
jgi:cytochrome c-type biogenesis protein CcmH